MNVPKKTCDDNKFCKLRSIDGRIVLRDCSDITDFPDDYEPVAGDTNKRCKVSKGKSQKDCLCNSDLCNENTMASTSNQSAMASITLLTSLLVTKAIFM